MRLSSAFTRTGADIVAEILMIRTTFQGTILLLEGPSDSRFIMRHILVPNTQIVICGGKSAALEAMRLLKSRPSHGCLAVVDRDFDHHTGVMTGPPVFYTDTHDLETLLLSLRLSTLVEEFGDEHKIRDYVRDSGDPVEVAVLKRCEPFARLRYVSKAVPQVGTTMKDFSPWKYFSVPDWKLDELRLTQDFADACGWTVEQLEDHLKACPLLWGWGDVQGHDALAVVSIGLREFLGGGAQVGEKQLQSCLRLACHETDFKKTTLYRGMKGWEEENDMTFLR